jgi:glycosyltransferase involved in cell wall biosynthesis
MEKRQNGGLPPGVSLVVPVFNKAAILERVLAALPPHLDGLDGEIILVDDGSSDDSPRIIEAFCKTEPRARAIRRENGGSAAASNTGIAAARYSRIKFCDADDFILSGAVAALYRVLENEPQAVAAWGGLKTFTDPARIDTDASFDESAVFDRVPDPLLALLRSSVCNPTQLMVDTAAAKAAGGCDERVVHSQEYSLLLRLAWHGDFLRTPAQIAWQLVDQGPSLSSDKRRQLYRVSKAAVLHLADHPEAAPRYHWFSAERIAKRVRRYVRRSGGERAALARLFWLELRARLRLGRPGEISEAALAALE